MTATEPTQHSELSTDLARIDRERHMAALRQQLDTAWQAVLSLPEDHPRRESALQAILDIWETNIALGELVQQNESAALAARAALEETRKQRDTIASELNDLVAALKDHWSSDHPLVEGLYDDFAESHNDAFWSSLPYDMAASLGGDWNFMDADTLYHLLTADLEEVSPDDDGFTPEQVAAFRANLLGFLRAFAARRSS